MRSIGRTLLVVATSVLYGGVGRSGATAVVKVVMGTGITTEKAGAGTGVCGATNEVVRSLPAATASDRSGTSQPTFQKSTSIATVESSNTRLDQSESNYTVEGGEDTGGSQLSEQLSNGRPELELAGEYDLLRWSESLAAVARTGLGFTESLYERERFEEILHIAAEIRTTADEQRERYTSDIKPYDNKHPTGSASGASQDRADRGDRVNGLVSEWMKQVGKGVPGYVTPKVAVGAAVGNDQGQLLLIQRADSGVWLYPTGWADVGYSAAEVVVKEVKEETGIDVEPLRIIAVLDGFRLGTTRIPLYSLVFQCTSLGGTLSPHPLECMDVGWFSEDSLPAPLAAAERWKEHVFRAIHGEKVDVLYDVVRQPVWKGSENG